MALGLSQKHRLDPSTLEAEPSPFEPADCVEMEELDYESLPTDHLLPHLLAGGAAGIMEHCTMYPVDCVKVSPVPDL